MAEPQETGTPDANTEVQPLIPGTNFKTAEDLAKGYTELQSKMGQQGSELGNAKAQLAQSQKAMDALAAQKPAEAKPAGPDYASELAVVDKAISKLDIDSTTYNTDLAKLNIQSRNLVAQQVKAETTESLMGEFKGILSDRDSQQSQQAWKDQNQDFETPEMQQAINDHMAQDRTGVMDPVLAYREIQMQGQSATIEEQTATIADLTERLKLKGGELEVGKVTTKGAGSSSTKPKQNLSREELNTGAAEAFRNAK